MSHKKTVIAVIIAVVGVFYLSTIREGHDWGGDFSMYLIHAKNISEGTGYTNTGYIFNPSRPSAPSAYPPVFPLMLAPVYKAFGLNMTAMKVELIAIFLTFLLMLYLTFKELIPFRYMAAVIAAVGFNPYFSGAEFKDSILSEAPFLLWLYVSFFLIQRAYHADSPRKHRAFYAILAGIAIYLSYGTRSIGIVLVPSLILYDLIRHRRPTRTSIIAVLVFSFFALLQALSIQSHGGYYDLLEFSPNAFLSYFYLLYKYIKKLSYIWVNHHVRFFSQLLFYAFTVFAVIGYRARIKSGVTVPEIFLPAYLLALTVYSSLTHTPPIVRHIVPVIPLYIYYGFMGVSASGLLERKNTEKPVFIAMIVAISLSYAGVYSKMDFGPITEGVGKKESVELFSFIRDHTFEEDVIIFRKPRVMALYTGRASSLYDAPDDYGELLAYINEIGATYLVVSRPLDTDYLRGFIEKYSNDFEEVYSNPDFKVYRIRDASSHQPGFSKRFASTSKKWFRREDTPKHGNLQSI